MPTCERVHSSLPTFLLIAHCAILTLEPHHFTLTLVSVRGSVPGGTEKCCGAADRLHRCTSSATPFRKDLQLSKNHAEKLSDGPTLRVFFAFSPSQVKTEKTLSYFLPRC